jgi:hypothetical protein
VLSSDIMPLVDVFTWHGMYGAAPSDDPRGIRDPDQPQMANYWENYPALVEEIKSVAASAGFYGEYVAEELLWRTTAYPHESEPYGFTDISAAKYTARAVILHLGIDVTTGLQLCCTSSQAISTIRSLSTVMAGAVAEDLPVLIESSAVNIKHYGFTLPDGTRLIALWTDGAAVDDDPGVPAKLTIPGITDHTVTGIDVLHGFQQQMVTSEDDGNLVIHNLLVKDYPTILRIASIQYIYLPIILK